MSEPDEEIVDQDQEEPVEDDAEKDLSPVVIRYHISSYGADFDVEGLIRRLERNDVFIPSWQRGYIWTQKEASRFVESLLLGLPVPGIFLAKEAGSNKLFVIDGQQRLRTLQFFFGGLFDPRPGDVNAKIFRLIDVQKPFRDLTFSELSAEDARRLLDSIIHATIVKQDSPKGDTSIYYIFQRLNTGGRKLAAQEIRFAVFHGRLINLLKHLNENLDWRAIFGKKSARLKDQELILRFFALRFSLASYERPMEEFLNKFAEKHRHDQPSVLTKWEMTFDSAIATLRTAIGNSVFRPERVLNAAVFDATTVGLAARLDEGPVTDLTALRHQYELLLEDSKFQQWTTRATSDDVSVKGRISLATEHFAVVK